MSLKSLLIFKTKFNKTASAEVIIPMLSDLRLKMNYNFYSKLSNEEKIKVLHFLFNELHSIWSNGPSDLKISVSSTVGHLLVNLGPFITNDLMKAFISSIQNYKSSSILYFSCFCYLSKFYSPKDIEMFTKGINILNLISINDASTLPKITKELFGLPNQMLHSLVEHYLVLLSKDSDNKYILKAIQILISQNPSFFVDLINKDMSVETIIAIFGDNIPILDESLVQSLSNSALQAIQDLGTPLKKFSASCKLLNSLIKHSQIQPSVVQGIFTKATIPKAVSLEDLLLLPIEPSIVFSIYGSQNVKTNLMTSGASNLTAATGSDDSQIILDLNSNANISAVFDSSDFTLGDGSEQTDLSLLVEDGNYQIVAPGTPMQDISFLPSLPLPDYAENAEEVKLSPISPHQAEKVTFDKVATKFDASDSPASVIINDFIKSSSFSDLSSVPPPSIPSILGGSETPLQPSLITDNSSRSKSNNSNDNIDKKASFASSSLMSESPTKRKPKLSLDLNLVSPTPILQSKSARFQSQKGTKSVLLLRLNPKYVSPLINYFKRFPEYRKEFFNLILFSISLYKTKKLLRFNSLQMIDNGESGNSQTTKADAVYSALKAFSETNSQFMPTELNSILEKIFEMIENGEENEDKSTNSLRKSNKNNIDIALQVKILELIGSLNADKLTKKIASKMFDIIDAASISKIDILRKKAKKSFVSLTNQTSTDLFKFFLDIYIQKLDLFNDKEFPYRIEFIAYVMKHIPNQIPVTFGSVATFLYESLMLNGSFHRNVILNMLKILSVLAPTICNPQILIVFIQHAMNIINKNYTDYVGDSPFIIDQKVPFFYNRYQVENTLVQFDNDLISNPSIWHRKYLKCARIAYSFLASIPWDKFEMTSNDKLLIENVIVNLSFLFPKETSTFVILLRDSKLVSQTSIQKIVKTLNKVSRRKDDLLSFLPFYRFVCKKDEKYKQLNTDSITDSLLNFLPRLNDISNDQTIAIKLYLSEKKIDALDEERIQKVFISATISTSSSEVLHFNVNKIDDDDYDDYDDIVEDTVLSDQELSSYIVSLTPLIYANLDVPPEFLQPFHIQSFCENSPAAIDEDQCKQLFEYALSNSSSRVLCNVIRYSQRMHYHLNIEDYLDNPIFNSKKLFSCVFKSITHNKKGFQDISQRCSQYIKQFYPNDFFPYVLNANDNQRANAISLMQFDPTFFINQYLQVEKFTKNQLINICIYIQNVKFPREPIFRFIIGLLSQSSKSQWEINVVRRIVTVFVTCYGQNIRRAPKKIYDIIACELGFQIPLDIKSPAIQKLTAADLIEFGYALNATSKYIDCEKLLDQLALIYKKNTPYYQYIDSIKNKKGSVNQIVEYQNCILPSVRYLNIFSASKFIRSNVDFNVTIDFINNVVKLLDLYVPLPFQGPGNTRIINDDTSNCFFCFAMCVLSHELSSSVQKHLYNLTFERMPFEMNNFSLGRFLSVFKGFTNQQYLKNDINNDIFQRCCLISDLTSNIKPFFIELFSSVSKSTNKQKVFSDKLTNFIVNKISYDSPITCEVASTEIMKTVSNKDEADNVLHFEIPDFYIYFIAISSIEKKNRSMVHDKLQKRYKGAHLLALQMLKDPKYRIFSPLIALIANDNEIPDKLKNYLDSIKDKIQRIYSTDAYHEF